MVHKQRGESGTGTTAERMEHQETLKSGTIPGQLPDLIHDDLDELLSHRVVTTSVIVGRIFFAGDQLLRVEQVSVGSGTGFVWKRVVMKV